MESLNLKCGGNDILEVVGCRSRCLPRDFEQLFISWIWVCFLIKGIRQPIFIFLLIKQIRQLISLFFRSGKELQILVMNDLYFHLQGELEAGRHIPAGAFEDLVSLLDTMDIAPFVFNSKERQHEKLQPLDAHCFLYDTTQLRQHLGLEWWSQTPLHIVQTAENTLDFLQQANSMACLGTCQVFTLDALSSVLSLFITTKEEVTQFLASFYGHLYL